jgi:carboxylate-amine ligase
MYQKSNKFRNNQSYTIGVEEEYMLCDPETGDLINRADEIMAELPLQLKPRYSYELLLSEIEINTSICSTVDEAMEEIIFLRNNTRKLGEKLEFNIGISGTHPTAMCKDQKFVNNESYNWVADQMNYYARRNVTFATHVHIAINDENRAIHVANALRRWIAPLLALSTNSPFFESELTGLRSSRTFQFGVFPRTNIPVRFNDFNEYEALIKKYLDTNTIEKPRQIWWKIRPHIDYGTIEYRICDTQRNLRNNELLIALSQALVHQSVEDYNNGILKESFNMEYLYDGLWKAARFPFSVKMIDPETCEISTLIEQIKIMIEYVKNSLNYFNTGHILDTINKIINNGTEADDQIEVYNDSGFTGLKKYLMSNIDYQINNRGE